MHTTWEYSNLWTKEPCHRSIEKNRFKYRNFGPIIAQIQHFGDTIYEKEPAGRVYII